MRVPSFAAPGRLAAGDLRSVHPTEQNGCSQLEGISLWPYVPIAKETQAGLGFWREGEAIPFVMPHRESRRINQVPPKQEIMLDIHYQLFSTIRKEKWLRKPMLQTNQRPFRCGMPGPCSCKGSELKKSRPRNGTERNGILAAQERRKRCDKNHSCELSPPKHVRHTQGNKNFSTPD